MSVILILIDLKTVLKVFKLLELFVKDLKK